MKNIVDTISRSTAVKTNRISEGDLTVHLNQPSVVIIHADAKNVMSYERVGNDLLIHMKDGSVIRCNGYFIAEVTDNLNELIFQDESNQLTQITFSDVADGSATADGVALQHTDSAIASISPLMANTVSSSTTSETPWGLLAASALGGAAVGAVIGHSRGNNDNKNAAGNTPAIAKIAFVVIDDTGDKKGILTNKAITDERQPTFQGIGQPGTRIDIIDANGVVLASTTIATDGSWSVKIPPQSAGEHTYKVQQSDNSEVTASGDITLTVIEANATLIIDTVTGDNIISAD